VVLAGLTATAAVATQTVPHLSSSLPALAVMATSFVFSDFATGVYHWAVDNYGNRETPVFGSHIAAFQGHHTSPWTIAQRGMFNNISKATVPTMPQMALLALLPLPLDFKVFYSTFLFSIVMSQEFHKWSHMVDPPAVAKFLQAGGVLISRSEHGLHHSSPFEEKYCIVSGICNPLLDRVGFFRWLEVFFYKRNGVEPNSWKLSPSIKEEALQRFG